MIIALLIVLIVVVWQKAEDAETPHYLEYDPIKDRWYRRRL